MSRRTALSLVMLALGAGVLSALLAYAGPGTLLVEIRKVRRQVPLLLLPYAAVYVFDALGWYFAFGARKPRMGPATFFSLRMAGEAINNVTPLGYMGGEPAKAVLLQRFGCPLSDGVASVLIAKTLMTIAQVAFVAAGAAAAVAALGRHEGLALGFGAAMAAIVVGLALFLELQRRGLAAAALALLDRAGLGRRLPERARERARDLDGTLREFYRERRRDFALSLSFFLLGWSAGVPEVLLMLRAQGQAIDWPSALAIESLATVVKAAGFFVPGSLGAQEAGIVAMLSLFGYPPAVSLPFSLLRRAREILWIGVGLACLAWHTRRPRA